MATCSGRFTKAHQKMKLFQLALFCLTRCYLNALTYSSPSWPFRGFFNLFHIASIWCFWMFWMSWVQITRYITSYYLRQGQGTLIQAVHRLDGGSLPNTMPQCSDQSVGETKQLRFQGVKKKQNKTYRRDPSGTLSFSSRIAWSHNVKSFTLP